MFIFVIKNIRKYKNVSLQELSQKSKMSKSYLYELENNRKINISSDKLYRIASVLNVNVKDLFYTSFDIENLRKKLHYRINKYGLGSKEVLEISKLIDLLVNINFKELNCTESKKLDIFWSSTKQLFWSKFYIVQDSSS